jgi:23S rRNA (cytosine1962-C5)-methyltransferase
MAMRIPILYRDDYLIAVDKPAGIPTHAPDPADPFASDVLRAVQAQEGLRYLGMHQRLDTETSGVLLFAARPEANQPLAEAFAKRQVRKVYAALVHGMPPRMEGVIDEPIVRDRGERYRVTSPGDPRGKPARTRYRVVERSAAEAAPTGRGLPGREYALLEVIPETGRSHQIRVHLAHIGTPVVGDRIYGPPDWPLTRLCLHARELTVPHPATGQALTLVSPLPQPFSGVPRQMLALAAAQLHIRDAVRFPEGLQDLLRLAIDRRAPLAADPETSLYRVVNGAADGLPGLVVDRYGNALVLSLYDEHGTMPPAPCPPALAEALASQTGASSVYVKYRPEQASRIAEEDLPALSPPQPIFGPHLGEVIACEEGLFYLVRPGEGLNVGLFPDMRGGRARVRAWASGQRVLNCFAYTCGFGVSATAGEARRVLNLDLSRAALAWGQENYRLNGFTPDPYDFAYGDVFDWLARLARRGELFDLVILDPPGFSKTKRGRFSAASDYGKLAGLAAPVVAPGGLLMACCNVVGLHWRSFRGRVLGGLEEAGRTAEVAGIYHEPRLDYPPPPTGEPYLKVLTLRLN